METRRVVGISAVVVVGAAVVAFALNALGLIALGSTFPQRGTITLSESGDKLVVVGESGNRGKCAKTELGCVEVRRGKRANIKFELADMEGWKFTQIQLVAAGAAKLDFGTQTPKFSRSMREDFYVKVGSKKEYPNDDGIIELDGLRKGGEFTLMDHNRFRQVYTYQIQACKEDDEDRVCKNMDPMIENKGKN